MIRWSTTLVVLLLAGVAGVVSYRHALEVVTAHGESGWVAYLVPLTVDGLIYASSMVLLFAARRGLSAPFLARFTLALGILATLAANVATGLAHGHVGAIVAAWPAVALVLAYELLMWLVRRAPGPAGGRARAAVRQGLDVEMDDMFALAAAVFDPSVELTRRVKRSAADRPPVDRVAGGEPADGQGVRDVPGQVQQAGVPVQVEAAGAAGGGEPGGDDDGLVDGEAAAAGVPEGDDPLYPLALSAFLADVAGGAVPSVRTIKTQMSVGTDRARRLQSYLGQLVEVSR